MSDEGKAQPDPELLTVLSERGAGELGVVISNDMVGNPEAAHNSYEEFHPTARGNGPKISNPQTAEGHERGVF